MGLSKEFKKSMDKLDNKGLIEKFTSYLANKIDNFVRPTKENFFSFLGGNNDPDPHSLDKLRPGDTIDEPNDMFQTIFLFYGRNTKLRGGTTGFQEGLVQFGLDTETLMDLHKSSFSKELDTFSYYGPQAVDLNVYKDNGGRIVGVGVKAQDVYKTNMSRSQKDSMINRVNADGVKFNNQKNSIFRTIQPR